jgi:fimbrial chaperone protein
MAPTPNIAATNAFRRVVAAVGLVVLIAGGTAGAQALMVIPVNVQLPTGQKATTLTVTNHGNAETAIQIRAYAWNQQDGTDQLADSNAVLVSPPLASIAAGATQVVRLILRQTPEGREATYRILVDQIPPPAEPGVVHIVLRMSIPIFAQPVTRTVAHIKFHIERNGESAYLVAFNDGGRHEAVRDVVLSTSDGRKLTSAASASPYVLAGCTRRWPIAA